MKLHKKVERYSTPQLKGFLTRIGEAFLTDEEKIIRGKILKELEKRGENYGKQAW